jgi:gliding motility-associated lipoprotein GldH
MNLLKMKVYKLSFSAALLMISVIAVMMFGGCQKKENYSSVFQFEKNTWIKGDTVEFDFDFREAQNDFKVVVGILHSKEYTFPNFLFGLMVLTPNGAERSIDFEVFLRDDNRKYTGKPIGEDFYFEFDAMKKTAFSQPGTYRFLFQHYMPFSTVDGMKELSIKITPAEE